jgi:hypothetical protein
MDEPNTQSGSPSGTTPQAQSSSNKKWLIIVIIILVALFLLGKLFSPERMVERALEQATGGDVDIDIGRDGTMEFTGGDGESVQVTAGESVRLPETWPSSVPVFPDATITYTGTVNTPEGSTGHTLTFTTSEPASAVASFYADALARDGWTVVANYATGDGAMISATNAEEEGAVVYIGSSDGETGVTLTVETK